MKRFLLPLGLFLLLVIVLVVGLMRAPEKGIIVSPLLGRSAPQFVLPNLLDAAQPIDSRSLQGGWYLFNVWGTWCPECRVEHETLLVIQKEGRVPIIGMDWKDDDSDALAYLAQLGNPFARIATDHDGRTAIDWGVYGAPETFLVNAQGIVVQKHVGALSEAIWREKFVPLLPAVATGAATPPTGTTTAAGSLQ
ncbi:MAG: DsbE family thiol:disulfide interchange protein [Steroidobacteraceae bacterium]